MSIRVRVVDRLCSAGLRMLGCGTGAHAAASLCCVLVLLGGGCSTARFEEHYHFPGTLDGQAQNYYRVDVKGRVVGTELRYLSGFFDERALDRYFNTFSQPQGGAILEAASGDGATPEAANLSPDEVRSADPDGRGRKLVLFLSQNSEAVAEQIGSLAQSEAFANIVGQLIFSDEIEEILEAQSEAERLMDAVEGAQTRAGRLGPVLAAGALTGNPAKEQLLLYLYSVAAPLGRRTPFATFAEATDWLNEQRSNLVEGAGS